MDHSKVSLSTPIYKINEEDLCLEERKIFGVRLLPSFDGKTEELNIHNSTLQITIEKGETIYFSLDEEGSIVENAIGYVLDEEIGKQELSILKTRESQAVYE